MFEPANYGGGFLLLAAAGLMLISAALPAPALGAEPGDYRGTFRVEDLASAEAARDGAVQQVSSMMPALFRPFVRKRLMTSSTVTLFFEFDPSPGRMTISSDRSSGWTTDLQATEVELTPKGGKSFYLSRWMEQGVLCTRGRRGSGSRQSRFELSADGSRLTVITTISNKRLPEAVVYKTGYMRSEASTSAAP